MSKKYPLYILIGALFILGISIGFFAGRFYTQNSGVVEQIEDSKANNVLFNSQTASLRGEITGVEGQTLNIKNINNNSTGTLRASNRLTIIRPGSQPQAASSSAALSLLELNKEVLISAEMVNGEYEAVIIQYPLPAPSLPPIPSRQPIQTP